MTANDHTNEEPVWDVVHHISNYYDVPLQGVADVNGVPHVFFLHDEHYRRVSEDTRAPDSDGDDWEIDLTYALHTVPARLMESLLEKNEIFERWHRAYRQDIRLMDAHPALPEDRSRYQALEAEVKPALEALQKTTPAQVLMGRFRTSERRLPPGSSRWIGFDVAWGPASGP
jgi:hypothetical protein